MKNVVTAVCIIAATIVIGVSIGNAVVFVVTHSNVASMMRGV